MCGSYNHGFAEKNRMDFSRERACRQNPARLLLLGIAAGVGTWLAGFA